MSAKIEPGWPAFDDSDVLAWMPDWVPYRSFLWNQRAGGMQDNQKNEYALIELGMFLLSEKKVSCRSDLKTVLINASEQPAGRPKKRGSLITAERKNASLKKFKQLRSYAVGKNQLIYQDE